jgi:hypothetical protein
MIIAFKTTITDPEFTRKYSEYVNYVGKDRAIYVKALEDALAKVFGSSQARGGSEKLVPDIPITDTRVIDALSSVLGGVKVTDTEAKFKRSQGSITNEDYRYRGATIGESKLTDLLKQAALKNSDDKTITEITEELSTKLNANKGALLYKALKKDTELFNDFYKKSSFLQIAKKIGNEPVTVTSIYIPLSDFKIPPFKFEYSRYKDTIYTSLDDIYERDLIDRLSKQSMISLQEATMENFIEGLKSLKFKKTTLTVGKIKKDQQFFTISLPTGGSIPMSSTSVIKTKKVAKKATEPLPQKIISDAQLTALVQKAAENRMPKGPFRGPPLSPTVLTYRTGTFVDSIQVMQDLRQNLITYYYAPNYKIHERKGARAPRFLLQSSIRETVKLIYSQQFRIIRGF